MAFIFQSSPALWHVKIYLYEISVTLKKILLIITLQMNLSFPRRIGGPEWMTTSIWTIC